MRLLLVGLGQYIIRDQLAVIELLLVFSYFEKTVVAKSSVKVKYGTMAHGWPIIVKDYVVWASCLFRHSNDGIFDN